MRKLAVLKVLRERCAARQSSVPQTTMERFVARRGITWGGPPSALLDVFAVRGSNPRPALVTSNPNDIERKENCARYGECLSKAVNRRWFGFHCVACKVVDPMDEEQQRSDREALTRLVAFVMTRRGRRA